MATSGPWPQQRSLKEGRYASRISIAGPSVPPPSSSSSPSRHDLSPFTLFGFEISLGSEGFLGFSDDGFHVEGDEDEQEEADHREAFDDGAEKEFGVREASFRGDDRVPRGAAS
ncbi:hypothetical protein J5N97_014949 [Dioscorea zingiberensis]|uniref:Uncharacterized protein n=1 Tax=Dioscorea zingiberensis TaxID=325984 RepID=A0A9D5CTA9_9LILI|nr:hypothetical protein J5N97_014949 [Dioscorea zingiberensis]